MTELKDKAIDIKGKQYVLVSDRVIAFNDTYKNGVIQTKLLSSFDADMVVMMAKVTPDMEKPERYFTGYSQATWGDGMVNKTAALENCETSAVGRALGFMGIGVLDSIASADEVKKAQTQPAYATKTVTKPQTPTGLHCDYHNTEMKLNKNGKPYHMDRTRPEGDQFCNGMGFQGEKDAWRKKVTTPVDETVIPVEPTDRDFEESIGAKVAEEIPF